MITKLEGILEIHHEKGEMLFQVVHSKDISKYGVVPLRIKGLETPIPQSQKGFTFEIDITETRWNEPEGAIVPEFHSVPERDEEVAELQSAFNHSQSKTVHEKPCRHCGSYYCDDGSSGCLIY